METVLDADHAFHGCASAFANHLKSVETDNKCGNDVAGFTREDWHSHYFVNYAAGGVANFGEIPDLLRFRLSLYRQLCVCFRGQFANIFQVWRRKNSARSI